MRRSGVIDNVTHRPISAQVPVECVMYSTGFAPSSPWKPIQARCASGSRHATKIGGLSHRIFMCRERSFIFVLKLKVTLVILPKVHAVVQSCNLVAVTVEHQRLDPFAKKRSVQASLRGLAPARMIHLRIDVGIEAVF